MDYLFYKSNQKHNNVYHNEVEGIYYIEKIFKLCLSARAIIECEKGDGKECPPLKWFCNDNSHCHHCKCADTELSQFIGRKVDKHGQEDAPHAIVDIKAFIRIKLGAGNTEIAEPDENYAHKRAVYGAIVFYKRLYCKDECDREGEGDKNPHIEIVHKHEIENLEHKSHARYQAKIFFAVFCVLAALCDKICIDGEGKSADDSENIFVREKSHANVVDYHTDKCDYL